MTVIMNTDILGALIFDCYPYFICTRVEDFRIKVGVRCEDK